MKHVAIITILVLITGLVISLIPVRECLDWNFETQSFVAPSEITTEDRKKYGSATYCDSTTIAEKSANWINNQLFP